MKTLWLLRHAKASPGGADTADRDRPLAARGREAAARIGRHLAVRGARFDLVLCSPALRTRQTFELVAKQLDPDAVRAIEFESDLYLASDRDLQGRVEQVSDRVSSLLLVGHNPGLAELALHLAVRGDSEALADLRRKFPTGALAELAADSPHWSGFARRCELLSYAVPRQLEA